MDDGVHLMSLKDSNVTQICVINCLVKNHHSIIAFRFKNSSVSKMMKFRQVLSKGDEFKYIHPYTNQVGVKFTPNFLIVSITFDNIQCTNTPRLCWWLPHLAD